MSTSSVVGRTSAVRQAGRGGPLVGPADDLHDEIETALITADVGMPATTALVEDLRKRMKSREFADANALLAGLGTNLNQLPKGLGTRLAEPFESVGAA